MDLSYYITMYLSENDEDVSVLKDVDNVIDESCEVVGACLEELEALCNSPHSVLNHQVHYYDHTVEICSSTKSNRASTDV